MYTSYIYIVSKNAYYVQIFNVYCKINFMQALDKRYKNYLPK